MSQNSNEELMKEALEKARLLVKSHKALREELEFRRAENEDLRKTIENQSSTIEDLNNRLKVQQLSNFVPDDESQRIELKRKLTQYIKEIDKCIGMLSV
jgi:hypothetical protein